MTVIAYQEWPNRFGRPVWAGIPGKLVGVSTDRKVVVVRIARYGNVALPRTCVLSLEGRGDS